MHHLPASSYQGLVDDHPALVPVVVEASVIGDVVAHVEHQAAAGRLGVEDVGYVVIDGEYLGCVFVDFSDVALDRVLGVETGETREHVHLHCFRCHVTRTNERIRKRRTTDRKKHHRRKKNKASLVAGKCKRALRIFLMMRASCTAQLPNCLEVFLNKSKKCQDCCLQTSSVHVAV